MHNFKKLNVWELAMEIANDVYVLTTKFPKEEIFGLTSQMRRCAVSIPSNIAEGSGRTDKDFARFLSMALSSAFELETQLLISLEQKFSDITIADTITNKISNVQKMIYKLKQKLLTNQ